MVRTKKSKRFPHAPEEHAALSALLSNLEAAIFTVVISFSQKHMNLRALQLRSTTYVLAEVLVKNALTLLRSSRHILGLRNFHHKRVPLIACIVVALLFALAGSGEAGKSEDRQRFNEANKRWQGASCRNRVQIEVKKKKKRDGWYKCEWLFWQETRGNERVEVLVSDGNTIRQNFVGGVIPAGTDFKAVGWELDDSKELVLRLELIDPPVQIKVYFWDDWVGRVPLSHITDFERWVRFDFMEIIATPDEQLVSVATAAPSPDPPSSSNAPSSLPSEASPEVSGPVTIRVLATSVEPTLALPGGDVELQVIYAVEGLQSGTEIEVRELRTIIHGGQELTTIVATAQRDNGTHQSKQSLRLPSTLETGFYKLKVSLVSTTDIVSGTAIFEVRSGR